MTKEREALRMALDALQKIYIAPEHEEYIRVWWPACEQAITAIKEALQSNEHVEPVAWLIADGEDLWATNEKNMMLDYPKSQVTPLYTTPPQHKPLTEWQMCNIAEQCGCMSADWIDFARAIEAAHGIKE